VPFALALSGATFSTTLKTKEKGKERNFYNQFIKEGELLIKL